MEEKLSNENSDIEFLNRMHEEKLASQKRRSEFNIKKFVFIGALFTVGAAKLPEEIDLSLILYIVPLISICFDLYILGEDYGIKRIGGFISLNYQNTIDSNWEDWVGKKRDPFATFAVPLLSLVILVACCAILWKTESTSFWFWIWLCLLFCTILFLFFYSQFLRKRLLINNDETIKIKGKLTNNHDM